ncbi:MAG: hypothetical protein JXB32_01730 [Deltaproteobacteria bacterium]|nr:hypothetical protein [Deltaproteobacteria bacterium]
MDCECSVEFSDTLLVKIPDLDAITFEEGPWPCSLLSVGPNLRSIERQAATNHWRAQLFEQPDYQAWPTDVPYDGTWPIVPSTPGSIRSLVLLGPAARLCQDAECSVFTDVVEPDLFSPGVKANTEGVLQEWPGRVSRKEMANGDHATCDYSTCCDYCTWKFQVKDDDVVAYPVDPNAHIENDISRVLVRDPYIHLAWCRDPGFNDCRPMYLTGPADLDLTGGAWDDEIESFDMVRDLGDALEDTGPGPLRPFDEIRPYLNRPWGGKASKKGPGKTCGGHGGLGNYPWPPTTCTAHDDCSYPYVCTTEGICAVGACFAGVYSDGSSTEIRTFYDLYVDKNVVGFDLVAIYGQALPLPAVQWVHATATNAVAFLRGEYPDAAPEHAFDRMVLGYQDFDVVVRPDTWYSGCPGGYVDVPMLGFVRPGGVPIAYGDRKRIMETFHEFGHVAETFYQGRGFGNCKLEPGAADGGLSETIPKMLEQSHGDENIDYEGVLHSWPYMEYCRVSAATAGPWPCLNLKFSDFPVYNTYALGYAAFTQFAYLSSQFMMPDPGMSGAAMDPRPYTHSVTTPTPMELYKPLRYHRYVRGVMDTFPAPYVCNRSAPDERYVWINAMSTAATAGTVQFDDYVRCIDRDPSACELGAAPANFEPSSNFDHAFARWGQTHFLSNPNLLPDDVPYSDAQRSRMHLKYEPGGIQGIYNHGAQENPSLTSLLFYLPTATKLTIVITAETNWYSSGDPLWRDALRVWVDTDDAAHRAGGRMYDDEYYETEQCWAFGHDAPGPIGCRYTIGGETESDGGDCDTGLRATMRFIPSTAFPAWATGNVPAGFHTVHIGAFNDPRVYSVEVVQGEIVPYNRPRKLRLYYCCARNGWHFFGDDCPVESNHWCMFDDASAAYAVGSMGDAGNKVIQLMAAVDRLGSEYSFSAAPDAPSMHEFSWIGSTHPTEPAVVGTESDFGAVHGEAAMGNRYVLRLEKNMPAGSKFEVSSHANPRYDHVVTWDRPAATFAAQYFPYYRGMNAYGFMVDPYSMTARVRAQLPPGAPAGTPVILNLYCESAAGAWSIMPGYENGLTLPTDGSWRSFYGLSSCARVYFQVGIAAPRYDDQGEVLFLSFRGS